MKNALESLNKALNVCFKAIDNAKIENVKSLPADTKFDENDPEYLELKKEMEMLYK